MQRIAHENLVLRQKYRDIKTRFKVLEARCAEVRAWLQSPNTVSFRLTTVLLNSLSWNIWRNTQRSTAEEMSHTPIVHGKSQPAEHATWCHTGDLLNANQRHQCKKHFCLRTPGRFVSHSRLYALHTKSEPGSTYSRTHFWSTMSTK